MATNQANTTSCPWCGESIPFSKDSCEGCQYFDKGVRLRIQEIPVQTEKIYPDDSDKARLKRIRKSLRDLLEIFHTDVYLGDLEKEDNGDDLFRDPNGLICLDMIEMGIRGLKYHIEEHSSIKIFMRGFTKYVLDKEDTELRETDL